MKVARTLAKTLFFICLILDIAVFTSLIYLNYNIGREFKIKKGDTFNIGTRLPVTAIYNGIKLSESSIHELEDKFDVDLKMFGIIPFSTVNVQVVDELQVAVLGNPFGMKIYTEGLLVIDLTDVQTENGPVNPAKDAGIKKGDYIVSVDDQKITTNEDLMRIVEQSNGNEMNFNIVRGKKKLSFKLRAVISTETGSYKVGVWVRDSSAGIGTLTFYSPSANILCGLGHGVCDEDTGSILQLDSGEIVEAEIYDVERGIAGCPGQLVGKFTDKTIGTIKYNCSSGVYSTPIEEIEYSSLTEVALKSEIKNGDAQIYCTVNGTEPDYYSCKVSIKANHFSSKIQNMIVTVTDSRLLEVSGGIVQGLSGSPILQNGKLIGAITHVLVDDPTMGYAIFAEKMLETAKSVANGQVKVLKKAS
ncbi:MAG: SpoIVB peptidase [Acutalibacteraceae bacterium]|jgi:stage IV sporulation protein B